MTPGTVVGMHARRRPSDANPYNSVILSPSPKGTPVSDFPTLLALTGVMGLSIFLSLPLIWAKRMPARTVAFLNAVAIGILIFLLADMFGDVAPRIAGSADYLTVPSLDAVFVAGVVGAFGALYLLDRRSSAVQPSGERGDANPSRLALIIAIGIGLQNLTEGLVFGSAWSLGAIGLLGVIFVGFFLQNVTEGFPILSPLLRTSSRRLPEVAGLFLIGGVPTVLGGAVGYFYNSPALDVLFDALAIGAILYVVLPMLKASLRPAATAAETADRSRLLYLGLLAGFVLGFLVNAF